MDGCDSVRVRFCKRREKMQVTGRESRRSIHHASNSWAIGIAEGRTKLKRDVWEGGLNRNWEDATRGRCNIKHRDREGEHEDPRTGGAGARNGGHR